MKDLSRTKAELIEEISFLRQRIIELEQSESERLRAEEGLQESEEKYRILFEGINDAVFVHDLDEEGFPGRFLQVNNVACRRLGYTREELLSLTPRDITLPEEYERIADKRIRLTSQGHILTETLHVTKDGLTIPVESNISKFQYLGRRAALSISRDITERRVADTALKESEERYRIAIESSNDGVAIIQNDVHVYVNQAFLEIFQYKALDEIIEKNRYCIVHPDDYERVLNYATAIEENNNAPTRYEFKGIRKDKTPLDIEASVNTISYKGAKAILAYLRNITERKQAEEEITRERQKLKTLSDNAPFGMVLTDKEGYFTYINRKFSELFGYDLSDVPDGRTWFRKAYPDAEYRHVAISAWIEDVENTKPGERMPRVFTVTRKDGTERIVRITVSILTSGDYLATYEDITELRKLENQLRQSQKMEAIGTLAAGIAHDFSNVLTGIIGFNEMVLEDLIPDSREHRRLGLALKGAHRGRDLVKQILAFGRHGEQDRKPLVLAQTLKDALGMLRPVFPSTIEIVWKNPIEHDQVFADPVQMHQVLANLCTNAAYAMREEGGVLGIEISRAVVAEGHPPPFPEMMPGEYVVLEVSDTGCGMVPETLERIFDPFFTTKREGEGTGLGLSVSYGIVKSHDGYVTVESEPGKGSTFHVYLPRVKETAGTEDKETPFPVGGNERILIVDDEDILVELNRQRLSDLGYDVIATTSSIDALRTFREGPDNFDLVITDQTMPNITGMGLAAELLKVRPGIPIILCTGHSDSVSPERVKETGIKALLLKPVGKHKLAEAIRRALDAKRTE